MEASSEYRTASEGLRKRSKLLFGSGDRLPVALAIVESDGAVNATDLSWQLRIATNRVRAQLHAFAELGFLQAVPGGDQKKWFQRLETPFWQTCVDLRDGWEL